MSEVRKPKTLSIVLCAIVAIHAIVWAAVNLLLFFINLMTTFLAPPWFIFPLIGWGIGLAIHAAVTFFILAAQDSMGDVAILWEEACAVLKKMMGELSKIRAS
mmetsp:Transcript_59918/g.106582  ORF Transcript_59918/g.106582 Transcript_59918/m.106582 type:complete len:103 (-) Transcript_59918:264-572(-)|eukprot:CAMPEP_0197621996 /NCGR_PEP_ID=MMETSP1338-20131121/2408_1 /TAXON_ID=43686 ORGANISM="Pelagodinium beii, Strain RCC1491" /NCGR_SAMPLE_ID=MMETSP1338 /ASSEMBLY_ACC=CAM_ASM_000754 /LENGTH=102 /DNA_ID=CAMNT_0043191597 /DNA_START=54 /DNA_END=362 /DNA_ORIENTATION=+